jgi:hypothetical protein
VSETGGRPREPRLAPWQTVVQYEDDRDDEWRESTPGAATRAADDDYDEEPGADWSRQLAALQSHKITLTCLGLILISLIWKAAFLRHYFYWQDDFQILDHSLKSSLSWGYLTTVDVGHFFPGVYLIAWIMARVALYNWLLGSAILLVLLAGAGLAALRVLRTMMGNRWAIVIPLSLYLFSPLGFPTDAWWVTAIEAVPLQIALFMALDSHLKYARTGRLRYAVTSAAWQFFGLCFFEKAAVIPLLLFMITVGFLSSRRLLSGTWAAMVRLWKGWLIYLGLLVVYAAVLLNRLSGAKNGVEAPNAHALGTFAWKQVSRDLVPGLFGGPWGWYHPQDYGSAFADPPALLAWIAMIALIAIIVATILTRRRAWRAWLIMAVWVVLADMGPVFVGRLRYEAYAGLFGLQTRYVVDAPAVLAIVLALVFWPLSDRKEPEEAADASKPREFFSGRWKTVAIAMVGIFVVGSVYSVQRFQSLTTTLTAGTTANNVYIANANAALADVPAGTVIVSQHVSGRIMSGLFEGEAVTSVVLGPLSHRGHQISWTSSQPSGTLDKLRIFGSDGRLYPVAILGSYTKKMAFRHSCLTGKHLDLVQPFQPVSVSFANELRIAYVATAESAGQVITVRYANFAGRFTVQAGLHKVYFPVSGSAADVVLQAHARFGGLCFGGSAAGYVGAFPGGAIPVVSG